MPGWLNHKKNIEFRHYYSSDDTTTTIITIDQKTRFLNLYISLMNNSFGMKNNI